MAVLFDDAVTGCIFSRRYLHAVLGNKGDQQGIHCRHNGGVATNFKMALFFDCANSLILYVAGHNAGEGTA